MAALLSLIHICHGENVVGRHGVRTGLAGIAAVGAVSAIIAAQVSQRDKHLARVGDDAGAILLLERARSRKQIGKNFVVTAQELASDLRGDWSPLAYLAQMGCEELAGCAIRRP